MTTPALASKRLLFAAPFLAVAAPALAWSALHVAARVDDPGFWAACAVGTLLTWLAFRFPVSWGTRIHPAQSWALVGAVELVLLFTQGLAVSVVSTVAGVLMHGMMHHRAPLAVVRRSFAFVSALAAAHLAFTTLGGAVGTADLPVDYLAFFGATITHTFVYAAMFVLDRASHAPQPVLTLRDELGDFRETLPADLLEDVVGILVAVLYIESPWLVPLVLPLGYAVYLVRAHGVKLQQVTDRALASFASLVDERDHYTFEHSSRVTDYALMMGKRLGLGERQLQSLYWTSRLHDLGKIAVDNSILNKPGALTSSEFDVMRTHPEVSARILRAFSFTDHEADVVMYHHERYDGHGYYGQPRENVPLEAFIIAVADTFDAMTSDRPYRKALPDEVALRTISENMGRQFHPEVAQVFLDGLGWQAPAASAERDRGAAQGAVGTGALASTGAWAATSAASVPTEDGSATTAPSVGGRAAPLPPIVAHEGEQQQPLAA